MAFTQSGAAAVPVSGQEDMFLALSLARSGKVPGESAHDGHVDEIEIVGWSWGMQARTPMGAAGPAGKATIRELELRKYVDRSSTALMQALRSNESVKKAVLTVRKAGGKPLDYLTITIEDGRLTAYDLGTEGPRPIERLSVSFRKICVEYRQQRDDGLLAGGSQFMDEIL